MKMNRRVLLAGTAALALMLAHPQPAKAFKLGKAQPLGWQVLPLGAGGLFVGFDIASDGSLLTRSDVGGLYRFTGTISQLTDPTKKWVPLMGNDNLKGSIGNGVWTGAANGTVSAYAAAQAPSLSSTIYAIMPMNGGSPNYLWALYRSTDSGATWLQTGYPSGTTVKLYLPDDGSAGNWRNYGYNVAPDPINPLICYCGMRNNNAAGSGSAAGCYVTFDGNLFNPVTTNGSTVIGAPTYEPGCNGILFDRNYGTISVGGVLRTKRIMLPVSGQGIFESLDGGQNFTATDLTPFGRTDLTVVDMQMDFNGTCYALISFGTSTPTASSLGFWRYSGPGGVWESFSAQTNFPSFLKTSIGVYGGATPLIVDPRSGHAGQYQIIGNGISTGFTSANANLGTSFNPGSIASVTWAGGPGPINSYLTAPSFDCPWLNHVANTGGSPAVGFIYGTACRIDPVTGRCVWTGNQGAFWLFTQSDLTTPTIPNFSTASNLYSVSTSRGTEATVAQDIQCAPGASFPCIAAQDVGIFQSSFNPTAYPSDFFPSPSRVDCEVLEYAASDPSFYVGNVTAEITTYKSDGTSLIGGAFSGYSNNYGATGSWTEYNPQPALMNMSSVQGFITSGVLTVNSFNSGHGFGNVIAPLNGFLTVYDTNGAAVYGNITSQLTGTPNGAGTYQLDSGSTVAGPVTLMIEPIIVGGQAIAVDADHHVSVPASGVSSSLQQFVPVYTTNARANPCTWNFTNLPMGQWMRRTGGYAYGATSRPFAAGLGADLGTVWAIQEVSGTAYLYRSTDSGATYTQILTFAYSSNCQGIFLLAVPGYPGELWVGGSFSGGVTSCIYHITGASGGSPAANLVASPSANQTSEQITMGAPASPGGYPTFFGLFWQGFGSNTYLYKGVWNGTTMSWSLFGPTGTGLDLPPVQNLTGFAAIRGDPNLYDRLFAATGNKGFAVYEP